MRSSSKMKAIRSPPRWIARTTRSPMLQPWYRRLDSFMPLSPPMLPRAPRAGCIPAARPRRRRASEHPRPLLDHVARDHELLDLAGALVDAEQAHVAVEALHDVL